MTHYEFVKKFENGELTVNVDKNKAGFLYQKKYFLPDHIRKRQGIYRSIAFSILFLGLISFIFMPWYFALAVLLVGFCSFPLCQKDAAKGVLESALIYDRIYQASIEEKIIIIKIK